MKVKIKPNTHDFFKNIEVNSSEKYEVIEELKYYCIISNGYSTHIIKKEDIERAYSIK